MKGYFFLCLQLQEWLDLTIFLNPFQTDFLLYFCGSKNKAVKENQQPNQAHFFLGKNWWHSAHFDVNYSKSCVTEKWNFICSAPSFHPLFKQFISVFEVIWHLVVLFEPLILFYNFLDQYFMMEVTKCCLLLDVVVSTSIDSFQF